LSQKSGLAIGKVILDGSDNIEAERQGNTSRVFFASFVIKMVFFCFLGLFPTKRLSHVQEEEAQYANNTSL
jgi:hypothetical protein